MTEEAPAAPTMPACNGSVPPEDGPLQVIGGIDEIAKCVGTVPYANAEMSPDTSPAKENPEENRNSLAEDIPPENFVGEKRCQEKREENDGTLQQGAADTQDTGTNGQGSGEAPVSPPCRAGPGGTAGPDTAETPPGSAEPRGNAAEEEEEEEEEEEDTEEDEVQVIEIKKENSEGPHLQQRDGGKQPSPLASPGCNSPQEKLGEQPILGKKNDISRHSYSRYNTISYRRIRKGNTKQRIDEFESMMHL
ncbi:ERMIN protein, partial [Picathartes gymnocephalus]|nr:ERMIN protein [Picathartes gymnocephalus]